MDEFWQILTRYQAYGLIAFVVTVFATPIAIRVAQRLGVMDMPDKNLKPHAKPIPYLGGAAICLGWAVALVAALLSMHAADATSAASDSAETAARDTAHALLDARLLLPLLLGGVAISIIGLLDDIYDLSPKLRLAVSALLIGVALVASGTGLDLVNAVTVLFGIKVPAGVSLAISLPISIFIVLGACNSTNLIDGLDGLCTGVTAIISFGFFLLAAHLASWGYGPAGDPVRLVLAIVMFGAAMGFVPWNFNPAKIFMGDAGSMLLGYNCGIMILLFAERGAGAFRWVIGALMIFALPVFDTALAMFRRWRSGRPIFAGDRSHFYDQLVQRGLSVKQAVIVCYLLCVLFGVIGLVVIWARLRLALVIYLAVWALTAFIAWRTGLTHPERRAES